MQQKYFIGLNLISSGHSPVGSLLTNQKRLAHDIIDICATHARLLHNIKDTDRPHKRAALMAECLRLSDVKFFRSYNINHLKNGCKSIYDSISVDRTCDVSLLGVPFHLREFFTGDFYQSQFSAHCLPPFSLMT